MLYSLTGFPFDLLWGLGLALIFRPKVNLYIFGFISLALLIPGFFLPEPFNLMYWSPGGASTVLIATCLITIAITDSKWLQGIKVESIPDRKKIREDLLKIESIENRQHEYVNIIQRIGLIFEKNNGALIKPNSIFFFVSFVSIFIINFSGILYVHFKNPDLIRKIFLEFYTAVAASPGTFEEWYSNFIQLGAFHVFIANMIFFLIIMSLMDKILTYRKLRKPGLGNVAYFQLPFFTIWLYIISGAVFFAILKLEHHGLYLFIAKNVFFIFSAFYIFQGISIFWLYLQIRLLPAASIIISIIVTAFLFEILSLIVFAVLLLAGLLDFWFEFRKKALQPKLFSDDA